MQNEIEARLARLEQANARLARANRRLGRVVIVLAAGAALALLLGPAAPKEIPAKVTARSFEVVDPGGAVRARFGATPGGAPFMNLLDSRGEIRAAIFVSDDLRPAVLLRDAAGKSRATLGLEPGDEPFLRMNDKNGKQTWAAP